MRNFLILVFSLITVAIFAEHSFATEDEECSLDSDGKITDNPNDSDNSYKCFVDMDGAKVIFHGLYLCKSEPDIASYQGLCAELFSSETGELVTFLPDTSTNLPLNATLSIEPGTYTHIAFNIGQKIEDNMMVQFATPKKGRQNSYADGEYCWTTANEYVKSNRFLTNSAIECGASAPASAGWSFQYSSYVCDTATPPQKIQNRDTVHNVTGQKKTNYVVNTDGSLYTYTTPGNCPFDAASYTDYAPRMVMFQQLQNNAVILPTTSTIEISLGIKGYGRVQMAGASTGRCSGGGITADCVIALRSKAPDFIVTAR